MTGTSASKRRGAGVLRRFRFVEDGTCYAVLERENGQRAKLTVEPDLARALLAEYGYKASPTFISVEPLIGMKFTYEETATGMLTALAPFRN